MHYNPSDLSRMFENGNTTGGTDPLDSPFIGETVRWIESQVNGFDIQQGWSPTGGRSGRQQTLRARIQWRIAKLVGA
jgi:hypothetical protein